MASETHTLHLEVATPTGLKLALETESVQAPSVHGEFGVLPGHLPLLAALRCGLLKYVEGGKTKVAAVGPGFVEAGPDKVLLITDMFAAPESIDVDAARKGLAHAEGKLREFGERFEGPDYLELQRNIDWAQARIDARIEHERI